MESKERVELNYLGIRDFRSLLLTGEQGWNWARS